jgi:hypothetical protein
MKTKLNLAMTILVLTLLSFGFVSGAVSSTTLVTPASSGTVTGTAYKLNATITDVVGNFSCTFYAKSSSTANSSWVTIAGPVSNNTADGYSTGLNITFSSAGLEDSNDYTFNASCSNNTGIWTGGTNTGITVNNGVPTAPTLSPASDTLITSGQTYTFTGTVTNRETTSCTYTIGRGGVSTSSQETTTGTGAYSATTCTFSKVFTDQDDNGDWFWKITASDGSDTTDSAINVLQVQIAPVSGNLAVAQQNQQTSGTELVGSQTQTSYAWVWVLLIILVIVVVVWLINQ